MNKIIHYDKRYHTLNPKILYYIHKSGKIVGYKQINKKYQVPIIQFYDFTRVWILSNELQYFTKNIK